MKLGHLLVAHIREECPQLVYIGFRIHQIAQAVTCLGDLHQFFRCGAGIVKLPAHLAGNKGIVLSVEENDRHFRGFYGIYRSIAIQLKAAKKPCAQL